METGNQKKLTFHGVDILNVNFNAIAPRQGELRIDIRFEPKVFYPQDNNNLFKIVIDIQLKDDKVFNMEMKAVGTFEVETELDEELRKTFVNTNALAIMFPYLRSFITTFTANLGNVTGPLIIPTQFFKGEIEEIHTD